MGTKFNRTYVLAVQCGEYYTRQLVNGEQTIEFFPGKKQVVINPFFTINFKINRGIYATTNDISIDIYNLNKQTREALYYDPILFGAVGKNITFFCGYSPETTLSQFSNGVIFQDYDEGFKYKNKSVPLIFSGRVIRCYSYRKGVDFITHIEAYDLPERNEINLQTSYPMGTNVKEVIVDIADKLGINKERVHISSTFGLKRFEREKTFNNAKAWDVLQSLVDSENENIRNKAGNNVPQYNLFYDLNDLYIMKTDEMNEDRMVNVSADTGLLETPIRENSVVRFKMLFEPMFRCGGCVNLYSRTTQTGISGKMQVVGFVHKGTVSPVYCGELTTELTCFLGLEPLKMAEYVEIV